MNATTIGQQIKALRLQKGITQEALAENLGVTFQTISKWENAVTMPDILMLPQIAIYFGISVDALFSLTTDARMERVENMLTNVRVPSDEEFAQAATFLSGTIASTPENHKAHGLLSKMYLKQAGLLQEKATVHAKAALEQAPEHKCYHTLLRDALGGESDLHIRQHGALIRFYQEFTGSHPEARQGYVVYLDQLLADYRLEEAAQVLDALEACAPDYEKILFYRGDIAFLSGKHDDAIGLWQRGRIEAPGAKGLYHYAERMMLCGRYTEAIENYLASFEAEPKPRFVDAFIASAELYERMGQPEQAITMRERQIAILQEDWHIESGEGLEAPRREIKRLKTLIK